jgi:hypothetical protein
MQDDDLLWLLSISPYGSAPVQGIVEQSLCELLEALFDQRESSHFEAVYDFAERWALLRQRYAWMFEGIAYCATPARTSRANEGV